MKTKPLAPAGTAPIETAPTDTAPIETAPIETAPIETAPIETAPAGTGEAELAAYALAMAQGEALPEDFYRRQAGELADIAAALARHDPRFPRTVIAYGMVFQPETPAQLTWLLDVTAAAIRGGEAADAETMEALCRQFHWAASEYLENVYRPALLNEEDINVLPGLHAFAWCFVQAQEAGARGDGPEAVRLLRLGLRQAPGMKRAVDFQVLRIQAALDAGASSPELLALAGQVRDKVARLRAAGDPGLEALLRSPAYLKFQPVIQRLEAASGRQ